MSLTVLLKGERPKTEPILALADARGVEWPEFDPGPWPDTFAVLSSGIDSTRGVEVGCENGQFSLRCFTMSSPQDYGLMMQIIDVSSPDGLQVEGESETLTIDAFKARFDDAWIAQKMVTDDAAVRAQSLRGAELGCLHRQVKLDSDVLARIDEGPEALLELIRDVVQIDRHGDVYDANIISIPGVRLVSWPSGIPALFPPADAIATMSDSGVHEFPFLPAMKAIGDKARRLDASHWLVSELTPAEWEAYIAGLMPLKIPDIKEYKPPQERPEGTLMPVLRHEDWPGTADVFTESLMSYPDKAPKMGIPLVSWVFDTPTRMAGVPHGGFDAETGDVEWLRKNGLENLEKREIEWIEKEEEGGGKSLLGMGEFASEAVLSKTIMEDCAKRLGAEMGMLIAIPIRSVIRLESMDSPMEASQRQMAFSHGVYNNPEPGQNPLCEWPLLWMGGELNGVARPQAPDDDVPSPGGDAPEGGDEDIVNVDGPFAGMGAMWAVVAVGIFLLIVAALWAVF